MSKEQALELAGKRLSEAARAAQTSGDALVIHLVNMALLAVVEAGARERDQKSVCRNFRHTDADGKSYGRPAEAMRSA